MLLRLSTCTVDLDRLYVWRSGASDTLTATEARLLRYLAERPGAVVDRNELLHEVWGYSKKALSRTVLTTMARLRGKLEADPKNPEHLRTVPGAGYELVLGKAPLVLGPVFGRQQILEDLEGAFQRQRQVTLVGPVGMRIPV